MTIRSISNLFAELDRVQVDKEKVEILVHYFKDVDVKELEVAISVLSGIRPKRLVDRHTLKEWLFAAYDLDEGIYAASYAITKNHAETLTLMSRNHKNTQPLKLSSIIEQLMLWRELDSDELNKMVLKQWSELSSPDRMVFNRIILGQFRKTIKIPLLAEALSVHFDLPFLHVFYVLSQQVQNRQIVIESLLEKVKHHRNIMALDPFDPEIQKNKVRSSEFVFRIAASDRKILRLVKFDQVMIWDERFEFQNTDLEREVEALERKDSPFDLLAIMNHQGRMMLFDYMCIDDHHHKEHSYGERRSLLQEWISASALDMTIAMTEQVNVLNSEQQPHEKSILSVPVGEPGVEGWTWLPQRRKTVMAVMTYLFFPRTSSAEIVAAFALPHGDSWMTISKVPLNPDLQGFSEILDWCNANRVERLGPVTTVKPELVFKLEYEGWSKAPRRKLGFAMIDPFILEWLKDANVGDLKPLDQVLP